MKIRFGKYYPGNSLLHRMDPRLKFLLGIFYLLAIFAISTFGALAAAGVVVFFLITLSRLPWKVIWKSVRPVIFLIVFIVVLNLFTVRSGEALLSWGFIRITKGGVRQGVFMAVRLIFLVISTSVFMTLTSTPLLLSDSMESLFSPLKKIRVPVHELALMMSIALRFIPSLIDETDKIMKAQASRGAKYDTGRFIDRLRGYLTVLIPLFVSAFNRAEELACAMEARCYQGGEGRTKLHVLHATKRDWLLFIVFGGFAAGLIVFNYILR